MSNSAELQTGARPYVPESAWLRSAKVFTLLVSLVIIVGGVTSGCIYLVVAMLAPNRVGGSQLNIGVAGISIFALSLALGGALLFQAVSALSRQPSARVQLPHPMAFVLVFLLAVGVGTLATWPGGLPWVLFPFFYVLGIATPIGWVLAVVNRQLGRAGVSSTWRETILHLSSGAFISTSTAIVLELLAVVGMILIAAIVALVTPGGLEALEAFSENIQQPGWADSVDNLTGLLSSPPVVISLFFLMCIVVPLIEELLKAVGVVLMSWRRPSPVRALWWGLLGGAGFALAEGLFNSNLATGDMLWGVLAPMRFGTTILHCLTGALMGLGWYGLLFNRRPPQWLSRYVQAVVIHALWNALSLGLLFTSPGLPYVSGPATAASPVGSTLTVLLFFQAVLMVAWLLLIIHRSADGRAQKADLQA